jgi:hypothetical protein
MTLKENLELNRVAGSGSTSRKVKPMPSIRSTESFSLPSDMPELEEYETISMSPLIAFNAFKAIRPVCFVPTRDVYLGFDERTVEI